MLGGLGLPPLDLPALLQFGITALALVCGLLFVVRNAASRYFVVDAGFEADPSGYEARAEMSIGDDKCFVCGRRGTKKCARCKGVRYCSQECQTQHWKDGHKLKCREPKLLDDLRSNGRRKTSGLGSSIALVPARGSFKVLEQPKKILFPYDEFVKLFNWDKHTFPPCGLLNCGNSCFANVVLQCLASTRPLVAYLLEGSHSKTCSRNDWCFLCELQTHIQKVRLSKPFSPINILSRLPKIGGNLGHGRQEDAHEFMRFAIDTMQSVCLDEFGGEKVLHPSVQETTLIQHIFGGHLQSQVKCTKCDKISNRYENMMDLTVEIHGDAESLEECLNQFTGKEWLDGENMYKCDGCDEYVKAWKRLTVHHPPNILTVTLKRFQSGRFGKLNKRVTFPVTLDLRPYMSGAGDGTDLYTLYAVVVHIDMLNASFFGHYICYTKDFEGNWYRIDDCKVMKVDIEEVLAQGAYMLLYSRTNVRQPSIKHTDCSKSKDEQSADVVPISPSNIIKAKPMESQLERKSFQGEAENLDLHLLARVDEKPGVQESGNVGLDVLQNMDVDILKEIDSDKSQKMDLDECPRSDSFKAVEDDLHPGNSVPEHLDSGLPEQSQNPARPNEGEGKKDNFRTAVSHHFMKDDGPIKTSEEIFNDARTSISVFVPEVPEPIRLNPVGPRFDHTALVDGSSHLRAPAKGSADLDDGSFSLCRQGIFGSSDVGSANTDELEQLSSDGFLENNCRVNGDTSIENGDCYGLNCNQLECDYGNLNSREKLMPLFNPGFLDSRTEKKSPNKKTQLKSCGRDLRSNNFAGKLEITELKNTTTSLPSDSNNCSGLPYESGNSFKGGSEPLLLPGFLNGHAQKAPPNGNVEAESSTVGISCKTPAANGLVDFHPNGNGSCNGILCESDNSVSRGQSKPLFSRGFLDRHAQKNSLKGKTQKQSSGTPPCKDNGDCILSCYPQPIEQNSDRHDASLTSFCDSSGTPCKDNGNYSLSCFPRSIEQNGDGYDISQTSLYRNGKHSHLGSPDVPFVSDEFLYKSCEKSQKDVETMRNNQNGSSLPGKANCNGC